MTHVFATECKMTFKVIQDRWYWQQLYGTSCLSPIVTSVVFCPPQRY